MQLPPRFRVTPRAKAFSLLELLVVMGIIIIMATLSGPALNALKGGGDLTKTVSDISDTLAQARTYAMANNTYVYVGMMEADSLKNDLTPGLGRVAVAAVASANGGRPYGATPGPLAAAKIKPISRLLKFDSVHLGDAPEQGGIANRETQGVTDILKAGTETTFDWPVGGGSGAKSSTLEHVIEFDPQGVARVPRGATYRDIPGWVEIPLVPSRGNTGPAPNEKNGAVLQVDGMTGAVRIYRP